MTFGLEDFLKSLDNEYVIAVVTIMFIAYASFLRMPLPPYLMTLFSNDIFRVVFLFMLLFVSFKETPHIALIISLVFVISMHYVFKTESFYNVKSFEQFQTVTNEEEDN
jgi:hypothetical protein